MFRYKRWDFLAFSAKAGVGVVGQNTAPTSYFSTSASTALTMSYDILTGQPGDPSLKFSLAGGFSGSLDHRDSKFHLTTTLPLSGSLTLTY